MGSKGCRRQGLALFSLMLLAHTGAAARLSVSEFDVLGNIQKEVDAMNTNLQELAKAIDSIPSPTQEPSPSSPTDEPSPTSEPSPSGSPDDTVELDPPRLFIARNFLTLELDDTKNAGDCDKYADVETTVDDANDALVLVSEKQLSNQTLTDLKTSNNKLTATTTCVSGGQITLDSAEKERVKSSISEAEKSGDTASNTIDNIVNPPTPAPEDDSGFRAATIALSVLFSLSVVALIGMAIYTHRQKSGGHMS